MKLILIAPFLLVNFCLLPFHKIYAQERVLDSALLERIDALEKKIAYTKAGEDHFMVAGLTTFGFVRNKTTSSFNGISSRSKSNSLADVDHYEFSPLFLWRHGNKILLEFEPSFSNGQLGVNWADISYFIAPGIIARAGYLVLPFGIYTKRLAAGWINKLATDPIGISSLPPSSDYAVEIEGGIQAGVMKFNYDIALSNGIQLLGDGTIQAAGIKDNNNNKTLTGRFGWLPLSNSSLELGASFMSGKIGDAGSSFENAKAFMYALDLNLVENLNPFQFNLKGQYNVININRNNFINPNDSTLTYSYSNHTTSNFLQFSLRPMFAQNNIIKKIELAGRYGNFATPANSILGSRAKAFAVGLDYWLTWRTVVKLTYQTVNSTNTSNKDLGGLNGTLTKSNSLYLQFAIQL